MTVPPQFDKDWFNPKPGSFSSLRDWHHHLMEFIREHDHDYDIPEVREAAFWLLVDGDSSSCIASISTDMHIELLRIDREIRNGVWAHEIPSWYGVWAGGKYPIPEWYQRLVVEQYS